MKRWNIWLAEVYFDDNKNQSKIRPVLIVDNKEVYILSYKMTTHVPRQNYLYEYNIVEWQQAGLKKPTTIRFSKELKLKKRDFIKYIGRLSHIDIVNIELFFENINNR